MADEDDLPLDEAEDEEDLPIDDVEDEQPSEPGPIEELASELGWAPKDRFKGDPEKWRPADEFIREGRNIQRTMSDRLKSMESQIDRFGRISQQIADEKVAERDQYWQQQHRKAVDEGDFEAADRAFQERNKLKAQSPASPAPEVQAWVSRNEWFNTDPLAKVRATEVADALAKQGHSTASQLEQVERAIRREFPEHFRQPAKQPPATQTAQSRKAAPSNRVKGFADMPAESQKMARDMADRNPGLELDSIAKSYWADVAQQSRRA